MIGVLNSKKEIPRELEMTLKLISSLPLQSLDTNHFKQDYILNNLKLLIVRPDSQWSSIYLLLMKIRKNFPKLPLIFWTDSFTLPKINPEIITLNPIQILVDPLDQLQLYHSLKSVLAMDIFQEREAKGQLTIFRTYQEKEPITVSIQLPIVKINEQRVLLLSPARVPDQTTLKIHVKLNGENADFGIRTVCVQECTIRQSNLTSHLLTTFSHERYPFFLECEFNFDDFSERMNFRTQFFSHVFSLKKQETT